MEKLEPRYALTAPVANDDNLFVGYTEFIEGAPTYDPQVLINDTDEDFGDVLKIGEVNGELVSELPEGAFTYELENGTLTLRAERDGFDFSPAANFTGQVSFTYKASDGSPVLSNLATVSIDVSPVPMMGDSVPFGIAEGDGIHLDDLDFSSQSKSQAPGPLTYFWYVDANEGHAEIDSNYSPHLDDLANPGGSASSSLDLTWANLNALGITDGQDFSAILTLRIVDVNGEEASISQPLDVFDVAPEITALTVESGGGGGCEGGASYDLEATFVEANPLETAFEVWVDWNLDTPVEDPFDAITADAELVNYVPAGVDELGRNQFSVVADHEYASEGERVVFVWLVKEGEVFGIPLNEADFAAAAIEVTGGPAMPPVVTINGAPASSGEGAAISLTSTVTQSCGTELVYAWSVTKDGNAYATGTATDGASFSFTPDDNGEYVVSLAATGDGGTTVQSVTIDVTNLAPAISTLNLTQPVSGGPGVTLSGSFTDPGTADSFTVQVTWGDGVIETVPLGADPSGSHTFAFTHTYTSPGDKPIDVVIKDDELDCTSGSASAPIHVALSATGTLGVLGTSGGDTVTISAPTSGTVRVQGSIVGSAIDFAAASVSGVVVKLGDGNDIAINTTTKAMIAVGGAGTDIITDAGGRGILIGGAGSDILSGGGGQDILIDSGTDYDADDQALLALLAYWNNTSLSLTTRVNNLLAGNGVPALNGDTIQGDGDFDLLIGGGSTDWILLHSEDFSLGLGDILDDVDDL